MYPAQALYLRLRRVQMLSWNSGLRSAAEGNRADGEIGVEDGANGEARRRRCRPSDDSVSRWSSKRSTGRISRTQNRPGTPPVRLATDEHSCAAAACGKGAPSLSKCTVCDGAPPLFSLPNGMMPTTVFTNGRIVLSRPRRGALVASLSLAIQFRKGPERGPWTNAHASFRRSASRGARDLLT